MTELVFHVHLWFLNPREIPCLEKPKAFPNSCSSNAVKSSAPLYFRLKSFPVHFLLALCHC